MTSYPHSPKHTGRAKREAIAEASRFVEELRVKHGVPLEKLYPAYPERRP